MGESNEEMAATGSASSGSVGWKKGLPGKSLKDAEVAAAKIWDVARRGFVAPGSVATGLGLKGASGGGWARNMAMLRGFGLIKESTDGIGLSDVGVDIVQTADEERRRTARRTAFFNMRAYRDLIEDYDGEELPPASAIASKLQFEYGKTEEKAAQAAAKFVESLRHAELLDGSVVRSGGMPAPDREDQPPSTDGVLTDGEQQVEMPDDEQRSEPQHEGPVAESPVSQDAIDAALDAAWEEDDEESVRLLDWKATDPPVTLSMTLDLSRYRADEVIDILNALGLARLSRD